MIQQTEEDLKNARPSKLQNELGIVLLFLRKNVEIIGTDKEIPDEPSPIQLNTTIHSVFYEHKESVESILNILKDSQLSTKERIRLFEDKMDERYQTGKLNVKEYKKLETVINKYIEKYCNTE